MFAKVAVQAERNREWIGGVDDLVKKARRRALAAMGTVAINLTAFVGFLMHRASEDGATTERVVQVEQRAAERRDALEREIQDLRLDVRELRAAMRRMGLGPEPPSGDVFWPAPDKISVLKGPSCSVFTSPSR
jgi:hypothetical protein